MKSYVCVFCGHVYDEAEGDPASGIAPGTLWQDVPDDWECSVCGNPKSAFIEVEA